MLPPDIMGFIWDEKVKMEKLEKAEKSAKITECFYTRYRNRRYTGRLSYFRYGRGF